MKWFAKVLPVEQDQDSEERWSSSVTQFSSSSNNTWEAIMEEHRLL